MSAWSFLFFFSAIISIICFHLNYFFPIYISVFIFISVIYFFYLQYRRNRVGLLMLLLVLIYLLPFIHIPYYILYDFTGPEPLFGFGRLVSNPYMYDETIISLTAMIGATGAIGIAFPVSFIGSVIKKDNRLHQDGDNGYAKCLNIFVWILWIIFGLFFSTISAPEKTLFAENYSQLTGGINQNWNFSSAWMISYVILSFAFIDSLVEGRLLYRKLKINISLFAIGYVIIWLQFFRGDRESLPWLFGIIISYYYWTKNIEKTSEVIIVPWKKIIFGVLLIAISSFIVGSLRDAISGSNIFEVGSLILEIFSNDSTSINMIYSGTWSAVLLTPLSIAGDYVNGLLSLKMGRDYLDIFLSLPPGFIADALGYVRPLNLMNGAAWEIRYGLGGTHAVVLPFWNFRMIGVFFIQSLWGIYFMLTERKMLKKISVKNITFLVTVVMAAPHWLWYGEKAIINALIIWYIMSFLYNLCLVKK